VTGAGNLIQMAFRAHALLAEVLSSGKLAVDLTAGNGYDTCFLYRAVGPQGRVLAFDIQEKALQRSARRLKDAGARVFGPADGPPAYPLAAGVHLIRACHGRLTDFLQEPADGIIANLGYLPGGDRDEATREETTLQALRQALSLLMPGGRLAVVAYVGHGGGRAEANSVETLFKSLPGRQWNVLRMTAVNRLEAPFLLVAERRTDSRQDHG
jgi:predicted methyltransferase